MKRTFILLGSLAMLFSLSAQEVNTDVEFNNLKSKKNDKTLTIERSYFSKDTNKISLGKKGKKLNGNTSNFSESIHYEKFKAKRSKRRRSRFQGHWEGVQLGYNSFGTSDFGTNFTSVDGAKDFELNGFNWNLNINFLQQDIGLIGNGFGLVTGVGFEFNNYYFKKDGRIDTDPVTGNTIINTEKYKGLNVEKSKLMTCYFNIPLMFEVQVPANRHNNFHLSAGVIGGVKLLQRSKVVTKEEGKEKRANNDFNISPLRYSLALRLGYRNLEVFANYSLVSMFDKNQGPEIYPFSVGITLFSF